MGRGSANNVTTSTSANTQQALANVVSKSTEQVFALATHIPPNAVMPPNYLALFYLKIDMATGLASSRCHDVTIKRLPYH
jgi:hypothetical protein